MARPSKREVTSALLERHGTTFAEELGIDVAKGTPSPLFRLLCASILISARIGHRLAISAAQALERNGWRTANALAASSWKERTRALNRAGYARYDERTSTMLGDTAEYALERYGGDLRRLREEAERDPAAERRLLREFKGIGDVGVDIYFREVQVAWDELRPFADRRALERPRVGSVSEATEERSPGSFLGVTSLASSRRSCGWGSSGTSTGCWSKRDMGGGDGTTSPPASRQGRRHQATIRSTSGPSPAGRQPSP
jgi:hypothetical protein